MRGHVRPVRSSAWPDPRGLTGPSDTAGHSRLWLRQTLEARGVDAANIDDACLIVSELVTNALLHGSGPPALEIAIGDDAIEFAVTDSGESLPRTRPPGMADETGGLGLAIVSELCTRWGTDPFPGGKTVWATLPLSR